MQKKIIHLTISVLIFTLAMSSCLPGFENLPTNNQSGGIETAAALTVSAYETQAGINTLIAELTEASQPTSTPIVITETTQPSSATSTTMPTNTQVSPSATSIPPKPTTVPIPCNRIKFIKDVNYPDNSVLIPDAIFTKTWRLENSGTCTWNPDYELVFVSGSSMGAPAAVEIGKHVSPGESIDVSVKLKAPHDEGTYTGNWMLRDDDGDKFGIGADGDSPFWVKIRVEELDDISDDDLRNFAKSYKYADWRSSKGSLDVPSPENDFKNGSVTRTSSPKFENGYEDDEMTLITIPSDGSNGMITGHYPAIRIKSGDRFRAIIGCIHGYDDCDATFQLNYNLEDDNTIYNLGSWHEKYEGKVREIIVDLSDLEGEDVEFHLIVNNNGSSKEDKAFWLLPAIK